MLSIDKIVFRTNLVKEYSSTSFVEHLGQFDQTMELFNTKHDSYLIEWDIPDAEETVHIGIFVESGTKNVIDYDGVFELPKEAIEFLKKNGFTLTYLVID